MRVKEFTHNEYKRYCQAEGSQFIVSEFALFQILILLRNYKIHHILEVGIGIGTISGSVLKLAREKKFSVDVSATESNNFCLSQLPVNLGADFRKLKCFNNIRNLPKNEKYDLIIIDGVEQDLKDIKERLNPQGIVIIEGDRTDQVRIIRNFFPNAKYVHLISINRNGNYSVQNATDYQGGLKLIFSDPNFNQLLHWFQLKIISKIKYYRRKSLN